MECLAEGLAFPEGPVVMADGSVQFLSTSIDRFVYGAMSTPSGGEMNL